MRLTIVVPDKSVYVDGVCEYNLSWEGTPLNVHALQWYDVQGSIEFNDGTPNEDIDALPQWALNAEAAWEVANEPPPPPTPEDIQLENKLKAISYLTSTDWAATVDISDPQYSNPYLANQDEFLAYRSNIRQIAVDPPTTLYTDWPTVPAAVWESAP